MKKNREETADGIVIQTITVNGSQYEGLIDTGCSRTILSPSVKIKNIDSSSVRSNKFIVGFDGKKVRHLGEVEVQVVLAGRPVHVRAIRCGQVLPWVQVII